MKLRRNKKKRNACPAVDASTYFFTKCCTGECYLFRCLSPQCLIYTDSRRRHFGVNFQPHPLPAVPDVVLVMVVSSLLDHQPNYHAPECLCTVHRRSPRIAKLIEHTNGTPVCTPVLICFLLDDEIMLYFFSTRFLVFHKLWATFFVFWCAHMRAVPPWGASVKDEFVTMKKMTNIKYMWLIYVVCILHRKRDDGNTSATHGMWKWTMFAGKTLNDHCASIP